MANIADGSLDIFPADASLCANMEKHISQFPGAFSYGGCADVSLEDNRLMITFTGCWQCTDAWDVIDDILTDQSNIMCEALRSAEMSGRGREPAMHYSERVKKAQGKTKLRRGQRR